MKEASYHCSGALEIIIHAQAGALGAQVEEAKAAKEAEDEADAAWHAIRAVLHAYTCLRPWLDAFSEGRIAFDGTIAQPDAAPQAQAATGAPAQALQAELAAEGRQGQPESKDLQDATEPAQTADGEQRSDGVTGQQHRPDQVSGGGAASHTRQQSSQSAMIAPGAHQQHGNSLGGAQLGGRKKAASVISLSTAGNAQPGRPASGRRVSYKVDMGAAMKQLDDDM